jgi:DNA topoisomerase VI subunit A
MEELQLPMLALVDGDPYGLEILLTYTMGSKVFSSSSLLAVLQ